MRAPRLFLALLVPFAVLGSLAAACSNQGEGERCDLAADNGGSIDCASGLVCTPLSRLGPGALGPACCPTDPSRASVSICKGPVGGGPDASVPAPVEAGVDADVPTEGGSEAGAEAGSDAGDAGDAGSDAGADADAEAGPV